MTNIRLLYVSKFRAKHYFKSELYKILTEALKFNEENKIYGALYYGNGYFIQCLEGKEDKVKDLFHKKILKDPRHENCEILSIENIDTYLFANWYMKYANIDQNIINFFSNNHNDIFNPYFLNTSTIPPFIKLLSQHADNFSILKSKALITSNPI